ncbi:putative 2-nitropropane dioxygenase [Phaeomoniella chlamydospora]|uniref:Putative 2-nitropropane dioxygenase n=1 Tax=Phaeomoniella chlamydospora TaxID=158046 RepID=A0A0G2EU03_PHACM|nr:putative 2-nitropropane dioxygenase [Phaeomoniella chlamydospora]
MSSSQPSSLPHPLSLLPHITPPLLVSAPMLNISLSDLSFSVTLAGGLGFLSAGYDASGLEKELQKVEDMIINIHDDDNNNNEEENNDDDDDAEDFERSKKIKKTYLETGILPIGVGFLNWGANLDTALKILQNHPVLAVWLYAPHAISDLQPWISGIRNLADKQPPQIWIQVGSVTLAHHARTLLHPDILVVQGTDAGGHGLTQGASVITLIPEVLDDDDVRQRTPVIAAGGIVDGRAVAACLTLGASGCVMGTRFLGSQEAVVRAGYRREILRVSDGGQTTRRSKVYDHARGIYGWPAEYDGRGVVNRSYVDAVEKGVDEGEIKRLYEEAVVKSTDNLSESESAEEGWGPEGRLCTYAGTGVGLVREVKGAGEIVREVRREAVECLTRTVQRFA